MNRLRRLLVSDHAAGWVFILPAVILIAVFGIVPIVWGLIATPLRSLATGLESVLEQS